MFVFFSLCTIAASGEEPLVCSSFILRDNYSVYVPYSRRDKVQEDTSLETGLYQVPSNGFKSRCWSRFSLFVTQPSGDYTLGWLLLKLDRSLIGCWRVSPFGGSHTELLVLDT